MVDGTAAGVANLVLGLDDEALFLGRGVVVETAWRGELGVEPDAAIPMRIPPTTTTRAPTARRCQWDPIVANADLAGAGRNGLEAGASGPNARVAKLSSETCAGRFLPVSGSSLFANGAVVLGDRSGVTGATGGFARVVGSLS